MDPRAQRQALTVALLSVAAVVAATIVLAEITDLSTDKVLFESVSAFATVGLSTGITAGLPTAGQLILVGLMFLGRFGRSPWCPRWPCGRVSVGTSYPEGRPIVG